MIRKTLVHLSTDVLGRFLRSFLKISFIHRIALAWEGLRYLNLDKSVDDNLLDYKPFITANFQSDVVPCV